jgi:hypothetical protein
VAWALDSTSSHLVDPPGQMAAWDGWISKAAQVDLAWKDEVGLGR